MRPAGAFVAVLLIVGVAPLPASHADGTLVFASAVELEGDDALRAWADENGIPGDGSRDNPVRLSGCVIESGLRLRGSRIHVLVEGCEIRRGAGFPSLGRYDGRNSTAILLEASENVTFRDNRITSDVSGIYALGARNVVIEGNDLSVGDLTIGFSGTLESRVTGNRLEGSEGMIIRWSHLNQVANNTGDQERVLVRTSHGNAFSGNTFGPHARLSITNSYATTIVDQSLVSLGAYQDSGLIGCSWECPRADTPWPVAPEIPVAATRAINVSVVGQSSFPPVYCSDPFGLSLEQSIVIGTTEAAFADRCPFTARDVVFNATSYSLRVLNSPHVEVVRARFGTARVEIRGSQDVFVAESTFPRAVRDRYTAQDFPAIHFAIRESSEVVLSGNAFIGGKVALALSSIRNATIRTNDFDGAGYALSLSDLEAVTLFDNHFDAYTTLTPYSSTEGAAWSVSPVPGRSRAGGPMLGGNQWCSYWGFDVDADGLGDTDSPWLERRVWNAVEGSPVVETYSYGPGDEHPLVPWIVTEAAQAVAVATLDSPVGCDYADWFEGP